MLAQRGRLLIPLIFVIAVSCCGWSSAHARVLDNTGARAQVLDSHKGTAPCSGEPDVGQYKVPSPAKGALVPWNGNQEFTARTPAPYWMDRLLWISRIWMARLLGVR